jgi:hypothetical protein
MSEHKAGAYELPIEWHVPEGTVSRYATNLTVQHTDHEFIISFYEIDPPLLLGSAEENAAKLKELEAVQAELVARIIVAPRRMPEFIRVLQENLDHYLSRDAKETENE